MKLELSAYFSNAALDTVSTRGTAHFLRNEHIRIARAQLRIVLRSRTRSLNLSIRQNHDNDCARMLSCRNSKHFHLNIPPPFRRTRASLSALTHTPSSLPALNYVRYKNCVSVFRRRRYVCRVHHRNIVISVVYLFAVTRNVFCFIFLSDSSVRGHACECADFDSGVDELQKGISLKVCSNVSELG